MAASILTAGRNIIFLERSLHFTDVPSFEAHFPIACTVVVSMGLVGLHCLCQLVHYSYFLNSPATIIMSCRLTHRDLPCTVAHFLSLFLRVQLKKNLTSYHHRLMNSLPYFKEISIAVTFFNKNFDNRKAT